LTPFDTSGKLTSAEVTSARVTNKSLLETFKTCKLVTCALSNFLTNMNEIKPGVVYTTAETQKLLKISESTVKRLLKRGLLRANKIGGQYRILGHEILRTLSPDIDRQATHSYQDLKRKVARKIKNW